MIPGHILIRDDQETLCTATALLLTVIALNCLALYYHCLALSLLRTVIALHCNRFALSLPRTVIALHCHCLALSSLRTVIAAREKPDEIREKYRRYRKR